MSHPEEEVHDDNVRFLRAEQSPSSRGSLSRRLSASREAYRQEIYENEMNRVLDATERRRPSQNQNPNQNPNQNQGLGMARRIPIVRRHRERSSNNGPNDEGPSNLQSVYGWAPARGGGGGGGGDGEEGHSNGGRFSTAVQDLWYSRMDADEEEDNPSTAGSSRLPRREPGERLRGLANPRALEQYISSMRNGGATAALLESVRRQSRLAPGSRPYIPDNNHSTQDQEPDRPSRRAEPWNGPSEPQERMPQGVTTGRRAEPYRHSELRRMYLKDPNIDRLKEAIQYLDHVRHSSSYEESLSKAAKGGFVHLEYFLRNEEDLILNTGWIAGPPACSWVQPGAVFSGFQQATHYAAPPTLSHRRRSSNRATEPVIVNGSDANRISVFTSGGSHYWARNSADMGDGSTQMTDPKTEKWPVKVTIHNVDYDTMSLSGTMEAYNIPDKSAENQTTHIVTYLEGEIIDFNTHSLETENFTAGLDVDSLYWRELEPFKDMSADDTVKNLVSKKWVTEQLARGWILMRWKG